MNDLHLVKKILSDLSTHDSISKKPISYFLKNGVITTLLFGIQIYICVLDDLPFIKEYTLLDIDTDFFIIDRIRSNSNLQEIGERKPWIQIETFIKCIHARIKKIAFTTIAYSVNEGYTPLLYKTIGDRVARALGFFDRQSNNRILAGTHFHSFRTFFDKGDISQARKKLISAINLNPSYLSPENTYGGLFIKNKELGKAKREFTKMLLINNGDIYCMIGMGIICIYERKFIDAENYFKRILLLDPKNIQCLIYLAWIAYAQKQYIKSKKWAQIACDVNSNNFYIQYLVAKLFE
jgi:tetratricopeptide (TPR) repeat protein